ncbi:MAG: choice-of-anchor V domain-containing protein [Chitinophagales bacterium]
MKKKLLFFAITCIIGSGIVSVSLNSAKSYPDGAPSSVAGAPNDNSKTCAKSGCHPGTATAIFDVITSDVPVTGYVPGDTYTITATVTDPALVKFGFEITPQSATGTLLGTMALSDAAKTKFTSTSNKYITHTSNGTNFPDHTGTWSFNWTAPATGTGDVTFYGAFDFSNNNGGTSGDVTYSSTLTIPEAFGVGINELAEINSLNVFPNPATDHVIITYYLNQQQPVIISLYDLAGKRISQLTNETQQAGTYNLSYSLDKIESGLYVVRLETGNQSLSRKIVKL